MNYATEDEAIAAAKVTADTDGYIEFDGHNCADTWAAGEDCLGWDGDSRRCMCGNRRVGWITNRDEAGRWTAYAEAY